MFRTLFRESSVLLENNSGVLFPRVWSQLPSASYFSNSLNTLSSTLHKKEPLPSIKPIGQINFSNDTIYTFKRNQFSSFRYISNLLNITPSNSEQKNEPLNSIKAIAPINFDGQKIYTLKKKGDFSLRRDYGNADLIREVSYISSQNHEKLWIGGYSDGETIQIKFKTKNTDLLKQLIAIFTKLNLRVSDLDSDFLILDLKEIRIITKDKQSLSMFLDTLDQFRPIGPDIKEEIYQTLGLISSDKIIDCDFEVLEEAPLSQISRRNSLK